MRSKNTEYFKLLESFIDNFTETNGYSPSTLEISKGTDLSTATVSRYLQYMRDHNMIEYTGRRNIVTQRKKITNSESVSVPILGTVACGLPKFAEENIEEYVRLPISIFGNGDFYILRAKGDSMVNAGISDGDLVLIKQQSTANTGQIIVALIEDEATLKRFYPEPERNRIRLHPENDEMNDIYVDNCIIQGIAVKVLKDIE